jgi:glycosyltransferase involved in cell wall biosynthesis
VLGIPGIYTAGASYSPSVEHLRTGLICPGDAQSWYDAMALLIENGELRRELATNALRHVHSRRILSKSIGDWRTVLASAPDN